MPSHRPTSDARHQGHDSVHGKQRVAAYCRFCAVAGLLLVAAGADWLGFRGPHGYGVGPDRELPVHWSATENVFWKRKLPGPGASSPIVAGNRVFVTCYSGYGVGRKGDLKDLVRHLLCLNRKTGDLLWQRDVPALQPEVAYSGFITEHGYASSTPAADGQRVYVFFGRTGVLAFDYDGKQLWQTVMGTTLNSWGSASSPVVYGDLLLVNATVESGALVALDRSSGKEVWRAKGILDCWSTPVVVVVPGAGDELVLNAPNVMLGFDPATGKRLWECEGINGSTAASTPVSQAGMVYAMGAGPSGRETLAVRAGGRGDVSKTHVLWRQKAGTGICTPVLRGDRLYWVNGSAGCLQIATGAVVFQERLYEGRQEYASAVLADGKLFAFTRSNGAFVLAASDRFERLAHNDLGDASAFNGSPALSDGQLLVRSNDYLYCIGLKHK